MPLEFTTSYIEDAQAIFRQCKELAEAAIAQVSDADLCRTLDPEMNQALEPLTDADLTRTITIRGEAHSVMQAINRQVAHYSFHCGQIVLLAKHFQSSEWKSLSVPRKQSAEFNRKVLAGEASQRE